MPITELSKFIIGGPTVLGSSGSKLFCCSILEPTEHCVLESYLVIADTDSEAKDMMLNNFNAAFRPPFGRDDLEEWPVTIVLIGTTSQP